MSNTLLRWMLIWRVRPPIRGRECDLRLLSLVDLEAAIDIIRVIGILPRAPKLPTRPIRVPRAGRTWRGVVGGVAEGSGALLTRNIGKINYLGSKAALDVSLAQHKLLSIPRVYLFEQFSEEMGCVAMFEWADPIQSYSGSKWTCDSQLTPSVDGGMIDDIHNVRQ
jgi:hypothetical protein